jgi:hypothetical protein
LKNLMHVWLRSEQNNQKVLKHQRRSNGYSS